MRLALSVRDHCIINVRSAPEDVLGVLKLPPLLCFPWRRRPGGLGEGSVVIVLLAPNQEVTLDEGLLPCL